MRRNIYTYLVAFLLAVSAVVPVQGQEQKGYRDRAEQYYRSGEYMKAAEIYIRLADTKKPRVSDLERIGECYLNIAEYETAENWYSRAYGMEGHSGETVLNYAEALKQNMRYPEAKEVLEDYVATYGEDERVAVQIAGADSSLRWVENPTEHQINNLQNINTDLSEFGFFPTSNGAVYTAEPKVHAESLKSGMTGRAYLKVFSIERNGGKYDKQAIMESSFNDARYHVGPIITNKAENVLYVTRTYPEKTNTEKNKRENIRLQKHNLELIIYTLDADGEWTGEEFAYNNVKEYSLGHAALSEDEQRLFFASDMSGGYGGVDIWYSDLQADGSWGEPVNAGPQINTFGDDMFPSVYKNTLFYSTNGKPGMGGLDIFEAEMQEGGFATPVNLRHPINSPGDDFSFIMAEDNDEVIEGFLSSNRPGGIGGDDIYQFVFEKPKVLITLEGLVRNKVSHEPLANSSVTLFTADGKKVSGTVADEKGEFTFQLLKGVDYYVSGSLENFHSDTANVEALFPVNDTTVFALLELNAVLKKGDKFVLEDIYYDFDKYNIRPDAAEILDRLVVTLNKNPDIVIELSSHTDSRGTHAYNDKLSQQRAQAAVDYLVSRGIDRERLVAKGYGERRLINHCADGVPCSVDEHQANRRTEIEVLSTDNKE